MTDALDLALRLAHDDSPGQSVALRFHAAQKLLATYHSTNPSLTPAGMAALMAKLVEDRRMKHVTAADRAIRDRLRGTSTAAMSEASKALYYTPSAIRDAAVEQVARERPWIAGGQLPAGPTAAPSVASAASARASRPTQRTAQPDSAYLARTLVEGATSADDLAARMRAHYARGGGAQWLAARKRAGATDPIGATARAAWGLKAESRAAWLSSVLVAHGVGQ